MLNLKHLSLRVRIAALMLLATLPAAVVGIFYVSYSAGNALHDKAIRQVSDHARELAGDAGRWDEYLTKALDSLRGMPSLRSGERDREMQALAHMQQVYNKLTFVARVDERGRGVIGAAGDAADYSGASWFRAALKERHMIRQAVPAGSCGASPAIIYAAPIFSDNGKVIGVLAAGTTLQALAEQLGVRQLGANGYAMLIDAQGNILAHPQAELISSLTSARHIPAVRQYLANPSGGEGNFSDAHGDKWLASVVPLNNGWAAVGAAPENEVLAAARRARWTGAVVSIGTVMLAGFLAWLAAARCLRPVADLTHAAEIMSGGKWGHRVEEDVPGELGTLARAFNRMSRELEVSYRSVEEVAEIRARELQSERQQAQVTDARLAAIVESSEDAIIGLTLDGVITSWNDAATELFGYRPEEAIGQSVTLLQIPELNSETQQSFATVRAGGRVQHLETIRQRKDGRRIHVSLSVSPIFDAVGEVIGVAKIARDITERKRAEQALAESERFARSTVDALTAHIAILNESGTIIAVNRAWAEYVAHARRPDEFVIGADYLASCGQAAGASSEYAHELAAGIRSVLAGEDQFFTLEYPAENATGRSWYVAHISRFPGDGPGGGGGGGGGG
jgi:two-component system, NtrC family, sensor kinase